jgi:hypothetical protein
MVDRRQFLRIMGAVAVGVGSVGCKPGPEYDLPSLAQPEVLSTLGIGEVRNIGQRYRALNRAEADTAAIRKAILASRPLAARLGLVNPPIATLVHADFAHGRTVVLDGWLLSITEARQCALLSSMTA